MGKVDALTSHEHPRMKRRSLVLRRKHQQPITIPFYPRLPPKAAVAPPDRSAEDRYVSDIGVSFSQNGQTSCKIIVTTQARAVQLEVRLRLLPVTWFIRRRVANTVQEWRELTQPVGTGTRHADPALCSGYDEQRTHGRRKHGERGIASSMLEGKK
jgi:hypothetical protein